MIDLIKFLKEKGYKVTLLPQRIPFTILKIQRNIQVLTCCTALQPIYPTMSLATVYKSLEVFNNLGLVQRSM